MQVKSCGGHQMCECSTEGVKQLTIMLSISAAEDTAFYWFMGLTECRGTRGRTCGIRQYSLCTIFLISNNLCIRLLDVICKRYLCPYWYVLLKGLNFYFIRVLWYLRIGCSYFVMQTSKKESIELKVRWEE